MPGGIELTKIAETKSLFNPNMNILSVGFGTGELECYLAYKYNLNIFGIETEKDMIIKAQKKAKTLKLYDKTRFELGSGTKLKYSDNSFDIVFCMGSIIDFFCQGLSEIYRVLKDSGKTIIGEVLWLKNDIPFEIRNFWEKGIVIYNLEENNHFMKSKRFQILFSKSFYEPEWWKSYYKDRGVNSHWEEEYTWYKRSREYLGIGLYILKKKQ